jgi:hypothetical protein
MHYVSVDVEIRNRGSKPQAFSSLLGFHLLDGRDRQFDEVLTDIAPGPPEGQVAVGAALRGLVVFEVPDGTSGLRFRAQGTVAGTGVLFGLK